MRGKSTTAVDTLKPKPEKLNNLFKLDKKSNKIGHVHSNSGMTNDSTNSFEGNIKNSLHGSGRPGGRFLKNIYDKVDKIQAEH
jgi:hypothetical protein